MGFDEQSARLRRARKLYGKIAKSLGGHQLIVVVIGGRVASHGN
jgi:hypothetical protein